MYIYYTYTYISLFFNVCVCICVGLCMCLFVYVFVCYMQEQVFVHVHVYVHVYVIIISARLRAVGGSHFAYGTMHWERESVDSLNITVTSELGATRKHAHERKTRVCAHSVRLDTIQHIHIHTRKLSTKH